MKKLLKLFYENKQSLKDHDPIRHKYRFYRSLLRHNYKALSLIAEIEQLYYSGKPFTLNQIRIAYEEILESVTGLVYCLEELTGIDYKELIGKIEEIDDSIFSKFSPSCMIPASSFTICLEDITPDMTRLVGSKALNLAIMGNILGLNVPKGFVITSYAFEKFLEHNHLKRFIDSQLSGIKLNDYNEIERASVRICEQIHKAEVPQSICVEIINAYKELEQKTFSGVTVAVRSSAIGEDTEATFAGQYETKLNINSHDIINAYKSVIASKYIPRSIIYRLLYGLDDKETLMAVIVIEIIKAKASGVLYTVDPAIRPFCPIKITSVFGMGEPLVSGLIKPDIFLIGRLKDEILEAHIAKKDSKLIALSDGGLKIEEVSDNLVDKPSVSEEILFELRNKGILIEEYYEKPQDIEWAIDESDNIFLLQTRPLNIPKMHPDDRISEKDLSNLAPLLEGGEIVSTGVSAGKVFVLKDLTSLKNIDEDVILVTKIASPDIALYIGKIKGLITEIGSSASHLASVAREFQVPSVFGMTQATEKLNTGMAITLWADKAKVFNGIVEELIDSVTTTKKLILHSAVHKTLREVLDRISPLTLIDPDTEDFVPKKAQTFHDIIRYTHEISVKEIFSLTGFGTNITNKPKKLKSKLPINIWVLDFSTSKTESKDNLTVDDINSVPFKSLWSGFTYPGVNWEGTMNFDTSNISSLFASTATSEFGNLPGGDSYAVVSEDYLNISMRFAYHFATIDALCGERSSQNYVSLQFSGGAGTYYGKSLRVQFLGAVLAKIGFKVSIKGDLIEAVYSRYDKAETERAINLMGRLLSSVRLLDISITNKEEIEFFVEEFFKGNYDFINIRKESSLKSFYAKAGNWNVITDSLNNRCIIHDGSMTFNKPLKGITSFVGRLFGKHHDEFFQSIELHHTLPLLIVKAIEHRGSCKLSSRIKLISGKINKSAGLAFGMKNIENYFAFGVEANEGTVVLYEFLNGRKVLRQQGNKKTDSMIWHLLEIEITDKKLTGFINSLKILQHSIDETIIGSFGIWSGGDAVVFFDSLKIEMDNETIIINI